jgi:hypothetical protein
MRHTKARIDVILRRHEELLDTVDAFARSKSPGYFSSGEEITFTDTEIKWKVNTSCHCHPTMQWSIIGTIDEFVEWCKKHNY